jgi:ABC-type lipoprotein release transport system permease subunit
LGAGLGALAITAMGKWGLPAPNDILAFLFSGPRLYPTFGPEHLFVGVIAILLVSIASTLYPARIATRIQPVAAMRGKD